MPPESATTLRGALRALGQNGPRWLDRVDRQLGNVLSRPDPQRSMHGVFGWIDLRSEVPWLVRRALERAVEVLPSTHGLTRRELVFAVHTVTLVTALFDRVREVLADAPGLEAPDVGSWHQEDHSFVSYLYSDDVPAPSAARSFSNNLKDVTRWAADRSERIHRAVRLADPHAGARLVEPAFAQAVADRYQADYLALSVEVPEFTVWAGAGDHDSVRKALASLVSVRGQVPADDPLEVLAAANLALFDEAIPESPELPTIGQVYVRPHFRATETDPAARLTDDDWWSAEVPLRHDAELFFAAHLNSSKATRLPVLVIGEAGSGKSTLTKALAAHPPASNLAVVPVSLRPDDLSWPSVADQIEEALRAHTRGEVTWDDLANHMCVVVLDGLDELLQNMPDVNHLSEVVRFQQHETSQDRPVAVVVTVRTSSVDRLLIPDGTPVLRLEEYDDTQLRDWTESWNRATAGTGRRELAQETVLANEDLTRRPRMLALVAAHLTDQDVDPSMPELSTAALRGWLADRLARLSGIDAAVHTVASLGMFNRGRHWISEAELHADLTALGHQVEPAPPALLRHDPLASYRVASFVLEVLQGIPARPRHESGDLPFALLSHRLLTSEPSILPLVADLAAEMEAAQRERTIRILEAQIRRCRRPRDTGGYSGYRPTSPASSRANATYSANLFLLRLRLHPEIGPFPSSGESFDLWRAELTPEELSTMQSVVVTIEETIIRHPEPPPAGVELVHRATASDTRPIGRIAWSSDGRVLATSSAGQLDFWEIADDAPPRLIWSEGSMSDIAWHPTRPIAAVVRFHLAEGPLPTAYRVSFISFDGEGPEHIHPVGVGTQVSWSPDGKALALADPTGLRIVVVRTGRTAARYEFKGSHSRLFGYSSKPSWTRDGKHVLVTQGRTVHMIRLSDSTRVWSTTPSPRGAALETFVQDTTHSIGAVHSADESDIRIHDLAAGKPIAVLALHTDSVLRTAFAPSGEFLASMSMDDTVRIWRRRDWQSVATLPRDDVVRRSGAFAFHPTEPLLAVSQGNEIDIVRFDHRRLYDISAGKTARRYSNAKIVLVGDTGVGKSGLGLVLSGQPFAPTESTHGRNVWTFEKSYVTSRSGDVQARETLLWDLAGQPGYRMVHQLHLNDVAVALVVFDARSETDPFAGVQYWSRALAQARKLDAAPAVRLRVYLVAARADRGTAAVSQERIRTTVQALGFDGYLETSAKEGWGVDDLIRTVRDCIDWDALPVVSSNALFEAIKDFVLEEKKQGGILSTVDDLTRGFRRTRVDEPEIEDLADRFAVCIGRLESVGVVRRMSYGDFVLLRPELLDSYASSLVQAARDEPDGLGFVREDDALAGRFRVPQDERLTNPQQERILLNAVVQELLRREIALKEITDTEVDLIFPSQFTRERPDAPQLPGQDVVFTFDGHLYSIYSTLAVRLTHSRFFEKDEMWHNSATYKADSGLCGIAIREVEEGKGELALFYDEHVVPLVRKQFETYVVEHLEQRAGEVTMRRVRRCGLCRYTIPDDLVRGRIGRGKTKMTCPQCDDFVIALVDGPDVVGDVRPAVAEMNSNANAQRDQDVAATTLKGKREAGDYDVFLCHNVKDKPQVLEIVQELEARGILPWLDIHDIQPGSRWQQEMAKGIEMSRSAAVLIGPAGPGPWHEAEMELINDWSARNKSRKVIPVILDGTADDPELPGFLRVWSTVDMRTADPDPIEQLIWGITGRHPRWV